MDLLAGTFQNEYIPLPQEWLSKGPDSRSLKFEKKDAVNIE